MSAEEFIDAQLRLTAARIAEAVAHCDAPLSREQERAWLAGCAERESSANQIATVEHWPLARLGLTPSELRVMWVLISQELDPGARLNLRELATEDEVDVSHDVLRRVVYGSRPDLSSWRELAPSGSLVTTGLIDPLDDRTTPEHRISFRIAKRVLALVHGNYTIDPEVVGFVTASEGCPDSSLVVDGDVRARVHAAINSSRGIVLLTGAAGTGRRSLLASSLHAAGHETITVDAAALSADAATCERQLRVLERECQIWSRVPMLLNLERLAESDEQSDRAGLVQQIFRDRLVIATARRPIARRWNPAPTVMGAGPDLTSRSGSSFDHLRDRA